MKNIIYILAFLITNLSFGQIDTISDTLEVWTLFSTGNFINQNAEKIVQKDWPFKIKGVAGDAIPEGLIDSVEIHNKRVWNYLDSNGYSDSKENFESDLLEEIKRIKKALEITHSNKAVSELFDNLRKRNLQSYSELNKINKDKYEFKIYSYDLDNLEKDDVFKIKLITDLKSEKARIIE